MPKRATNSIKLGADGVIRLNYQGPQTRKSLRTLTGQLFQLMAAQRSAGKKVYILADMRHIFKADSSARLEAKWFLEEADYDALAVVGNRYLQPFIFFVLRDFKSRKSVEYFTEEHAAIEWLLRSNHTIHHVRRLKPRNRLRWAIIPLITLTLLGTVISWQQTANRLDAEAEQQFDVTFQANTDAIHDRLRVYIDALYGFRGLFHSSDDVNEGEYHSYFSSLDLSHNYPGFNSIDYISRVNQPDKAAFVAQMRQDGSYHPHNNQNFTITPESDLAEHFIVTFVGVEGASGGKGVDVATNAERQATLQAARDSGQPTASDSLQLLNREGQEQASRGFLVSIPVYKDSVPQTVAERHDANEGFVNAVFDYKKLFDHIFNASPDQLAIHIKDAAGNVVYQRGAAVDDPRSATVSFAIAGREWTLELQAPRLYGISRDETQLPALVGVLGLLLTAFLGVVLWMQNRARQRAIDLASAMTEDIKLERNEAIATKNKDEAILSSIGDAVLVVDTNGVITLFNQAAEEISGFSAQEAVGQPYQRILKFYDDHNGSRSNRFIVTALSGKKTHMPRHTMLKDKNGISKPVADSAAPVRDAQGNMIGAVIVFRDITREKQLERMKDEFLSIASHELRTPMGAVRANVSMILSGDYGPINKELVEPLTDIKTSTVRLVELVNDLLGVARIEAGRMKFNMSDVYLPEIAKSVVTSLAPLGKEKGIELTLQAKVKPTIQADSDKIKQVLTNLIGNSLKFTENGTIAVVVTVQDAMAEVSVRDTGIGITAEDQKKLFGKFEQVVSVQGGKPAGTGLGLYISRQIIRKMGGDLWIKESVPGKGSTFTFTVPLAGTPTARKAAKQIKREAELHPDQK